MRCFVGGVRRGGAVWELRLVPVDLRHLRSFVVVAHERHIGRAAQQLFITQPALSRQMQQLEGEIGSPVLLRTAKGVQLTEAGTELLVRARVALEAADDALAVGRLEAPRGTLALGVPLVGRRDRWFALAQAFMRRHPQVEVKARLAITEELQAQVLAGELDGAVGLAPSRIASLAYTHVHDERLFVWLRAEHPLAVHPQLELADLVGGRVMLLGDRGGAGSGYDAALRALFADAGVEPEFVVTDELFPSRAGHEPGYVGISGPHDYPPGVIGIALVPQRTLPFEFVRRAGAGRAAVRAFATFAAEHLAASCAHRIGAP